MFFSGPKFCTNVEIKSKREYFITIYFFCGGNRGNQISKTCHRISTLTLEKGHFSYQPLNFEQDLLNLSLFNVKSFFRCLHLMQDQKFGNKNNNGKLPSL